MVAGRIAPGPFEQVDWVFVWRILRSALDPVTGTPASSWTRSMSGSRWTLTLAAMGGSRFICTASVEPIGGLETPSVTGCLTICPSQRFYAFEHLQYSVETAGVAESSCKPPGGNRVSFVWFVGCGLLFVAVGEGCS